MGTKNSKKVINEEVKLDLAFAQFWARIDEASGYHWVAPPQTLNQIKGDIDCRNEITADVIIYGTLTTDAINYYIAISRALSRQGVEELHSMLESETPIPTEFLPCISAVLKGGLSKGGPRPRYSRAERINIYRMMCYRYFVCKQKLDEIYYILGETQDSMFFRIWKEFCKAKDVPKFYQEA